ncbi:DUF7282 domain-containing protein [Halorientalis halophila]|uniref:DUF7282 domain-containing protein n=1 Tax=Halorientalis halophila TaxID=3108499 RepID=UPI00300898D8
MQRRLLSALVGVLALAVLGAGVAVAHGNHVTANPQLSANGTVVIEEAVLSTEGYLVLRADDGGDPGRVVGVRPLDAGRHTGVTVRADPDYWANVSGNRTLWAVLHADGDGGDGGFDPEVDRQLRWLGGPAGERISVARASRPASVVTRGAGPIENGTVPVIAATLADRGHLVVHELENGTLGRPLGARTLPAGRHTDVGISVNASGLGERALLAVAIHADDGDGRFDPEADRPVRVAGNPVASRYERLPDRRDPIGVNTPTPDSGGGGETAAGTGTAGPDDGPTKTARDGAGAGAPAAVVAVGLTAWIARRSV